MSTRPGPVLSQKALSAEDWQPVGFATTPGIKSLRQRTVKGRLGSWTVFTAGVPVPSRLNRAHKAKGEFTPISIAVPETDGDCGLFIAFKTRVPSSLAISIDAQFDPSTAREELIDNQWNRWLVERCADVLTNIAIGLLATDPRRAWKIIPLSKEVVGADEERWPCSGFAAAFEGTRNAIGEQGALSIADKPVSLNETTYPYGRDQSKLACEGAFRL